MARIGGTIDGSPFARRVGVRVLFFAMNLHCPFLRVFSHGIGALSAYLKQRGHVVRVVEISAERHLNRVEEAVRHFAPDVVGMNGPANQGPYFREVVGRARVGAPRARVIIGGWHATIFPEQVLLESGADAVLSGEGEVALAAYLDDLSSGGDGRAAPNFWFLDGGHPVRRSMASFIEDLDALPMVDYEGQDMEGILNVNLRVPVLLASRGCPWSCNFCSNSTMRNHGTGTYARIRSVDHVMAEVDYLVRRHRVRHLFFRDDTMTWNRDWALAFAGRMADFGHGLTFECLTRADCLDDELIVALRAGGCRCIWLGVDSGDHDLRTEVLNKSTTREQIVETCDRIHAAGLTVMTTNMVGLPHETPEMHRRTIEINRRIYRHHLAVAPGAGSGPKIFCFGPFPGTPLYPVCRDAGWMGEYPRGYKIYRDTFLDMPQFGPRQIRRAYRDFRYEVYRGSFPRRAWLYRLWDHGIGPFLGSRERTRALLLPLFGVAKAVLDARSGHLHGPGEGGAGGPNPAQSPAPENRYAAPAEVPPASS
jgi:radical SAM superfamily enzyme YgiQ (UPF0313 family)